MNDVVSGCLPSLTGLTFWDPIGYWAESSGIDAVNLRARTLLLLAADRVRTAASLACTPPMASLPWTPPGWTRPAP